MALKANSRYLQMLALLYMLYLKRTENDLILLKRKLNISNKKTLKLKLRTAEKLVIALATDSVLRTSYKQVSDTREAYTGPMATHLLNS